MRRLPIDHLVAMFAFPYWLFPLVYGFNSEYRSYSVLLPTVLLTRFLPCSTRVLLLILFIAVAAVFSPRVMMGYLW